MYNNIYIKINTSVFILLFRLKRLQYVETDYCTTDTVKAENVLICLHIYPAGEFQNKFQSNFRGSFKQITITTYAQKFIQNYYIIVSQQA